MKIAISKILLFLIPFIVVVITLIVLPVSKDFGYHFIKGNCYNHGAWLYDRIFENETPVDIVFLGSSKTLHGINEKVIETKINERTGKNINVVNFGYCQLGRNFLYSILKDLLKHKNPKLVFIEISEDESRSTHNSYPYIADSKDLVFSHLFNQYYLPDLFRGIVLRWEFYKTKLIFGIEEKTPNLYNYGYAGSNRITIDYEIERNKKY